MFSKGFYILILFIASFVFSNNDVVACCVKDAQTETCSSNDPSVSMEAPNQDQQGKCCCKKFGENDDKPMTPCGNCECNCAQSISYIHPEFSLKLNMIAITSYFTYGWYYDQPLPDYPLIAIWQPPQLS